MRAASNPSDNQRPNVLLTFVRRTMAGYTLLSSANCLRMASCSSNTWVSYATCLGGEGAKAGRKGGGSDQ